MTKPRTELWFCEECISHQNPHSGDRGGTQADNDGPEKSPPRQVQDRRHSHAKTSNKIKSEESDDGADDDHPSDTTDDDDDNGNTYGNKKKRFKNKNSRKSRKGPGVPNKQPTSRPRSITVGRESSRRTVTPQRAVAGGESSRGTEAAGGESSRGTEAMQQPSTPEKETKKVQAKWTDTEKRLVEVIMGQVISEGQVHQSDQRWVAVSNRLLRQYGISRSHTAIKNFWNREGRAATGIDERRIPNPNKLVTGVQAPEDRKRARQAKASEQMGEDADSVVWDSEEDIPLVKRRKRG